MTTSASRQVRSARNALLEALGLGETFPLRDLPVTGKPRVVPFGQTAAIAVEDSERGVRYRLLNQAGEPLPDGVAPEGVGNGSLLTIETPAITEDVTFTLRATRPNGRDALLVGAPSIEVGLDAFLPVLTESQGGPPIVIDHGATIEVTVMASQEGVTYRLVRRPSPDTAAAEDVAGMNEDLPLSDPNGVRGTGGAIRLLSLPLVEDGLLQVRAVKTFDGRVPQPPQTTLLTAVIEVFVRADASRPVSADPAIIDHAAAARVLVGAPQAGVAYGLHGRPVADADFSRTEPPDPATITVSISDGEIRIVRPLRTAMWDPPSDLAPIGEAMTGTREILELPIPRLTADTLLLVEARKVHAGGAFVTSIPLDQAVAILVRPDPRPPLRLEAGLAGNHLVRLRVLSGQPGIFYDLSSGTTLGQLYLHQRDPGDASLNKGIEALAVMIDLAIAADGGGPQPTSMAPPPLPRLEAAPLPLPCELAVVARRAMTGLASDLGSITINPLPDVELQPQALEPGGSAAVEIAAPAEGDLYALLVDGKRVAEPVPGGATPLSLDTGPLAVGARVELWARAGAEDTAVVVERSMPLPVTVG